MNNTYNAVQPAFGANFAVKGIKLAPEKLKSVQSRFSQLTQHYKSEELSVSRKIVNDADIYGGENTPFEIADFKTKGDNPASIIRLDDFIKWFDIASVEEISKALTRIFKAGIFNESSGAKLSGLKDSVIRLRRAAEFNEQKAKITGKPIYETLASNNKLKGIATAKELAATERYADNVRMRIQGYPIDAPVQWWQE